jgi:hypothetical protein
MIMIGAGKNLTTMWRSLPAASEDRNVLTIDDASKKDIW